MQKCNYRAPKEGASMGSRNKTETNAHRTTEQPPNNRMNLLYHVFFYNRYLRDGDFKVYTKIVKEFLIAKGCKVKRWDERRLRVFVQGEEDDNSRAMDKIEKYIDKVPNPKRIKYNLRHCGQRPLDYE